MDVLLGLGHAYVSVASQIANPPAVTFDADELFNLQEDIICFSETSLCLVILVFGTEISKVS